MGKPKPKWKNQIQRSIEYRPLHDGVTQGLLQTWLTCREKAHLFLKGISRKATSEGVKFGSITHSCLERVYQSCMKSGYRSVPTDREIRRILQGVETLWHQENPQSDKKTVEAMEFCLGLAEVTLPEYFKFWWEDLKKVKWVEVEGQFDIPIGSDGLKIRGKRDGVFRRNGLWLLETKISSVINEGQILEHLPIDFQTNVYLWSLWYTAEKKDLPSGVLYNVIRKTCLRPKEKESMEEFCDRVRKDVQQRPEWYFLRYEVSIDPEQVIQFGLELEKIVREFYRWWSDLEEGGTLHYRNTTQCLTKYGSCPYLPICTGQVSNPERKGSPYLLRDKVFRELED